MLTISHQLFSTLSRIHRLLQHRLELAVSHLMSFPKLFK
jgi:hypothetical protein